MRVLIRALLGVATMALSLAAPLPARGQSNPSPSYIDWSLPLRWQESNYRWWNSLTPRQQQLERAIAGEQQRYRAQTGQYFIPVSPDNLRLLMNRIGARPAEAAWVRQRMETYATLGRGSHQADEFLQMTRNNPYWYLPPHMRPQP